MGADGRGGRLRTVTSDRGDLARVTITPSESGARLRLRVKPGARRPRIEGEHGGALRVAVAAPPERGRANLEVEDLLADALHVARAAVRVVAGRTSRDKSVVIEGLGAEEVRGRLARHLGGDPAL